MPLFIETLLLCAVAFFIGVGLAVLLFRRRRPRDSYLEE
jgi:hypothetical protein